ncbi:MAG TPA: glycine reductase, partial [Clostridiales bacterium]|nr:glycine reductase [Clostridiales bacterium]
HDIDVNLTSHIMFENLVVKASGYLAFAHLLNNTNKQAEDIDYVIECSEEACGDMNQRGGGNFAKAIAELAGAANATGSDTRGFCAAPTHALIQAAALVKSGVYQNVVVVAGGATAKLGMNGKDHVKKDLPILEDVLGGFAVLISDNDGINPIIRTDLVGKHTVGTGSSPQAVITSLITKPLDKANMKITDIDKYSVEMQNPDITKPAGAGDVPASNYKMIGALGVKRGDIEKKDLLNFVNEHGMPGWAPTQGHIPSGVPYLGFALKDLTEGSLNRAMIVGKGSLFLGRMTNLFDGVSVVIERNPGVVEEEKSVSRDEIKSIIAKAMKDFGNHLIND